MKKTLSTLFLIFISGFSMLNFVPFDHFLVNADTTATRQATRLSPATSTRQPTHTITPTMTVTYLMTPTTTTTPDWKTNWEDFVDNCSKTEPQRIEIAKKSKDATVHWMGMINDVTKDNRVYLRMAGTNLCSVELTKLPSETILQLYPGETIEFKAKISDMRAGPVILEIILDEVDILWHGIPTETLTPVPTFTNTVVRYKTPTKTRTPQPWE